MKQMNELLVGETANVTVEDTDIGYATIQGTEYFVMGYIDAIELAGELATEETNSLDTYFVSKDYSKVFILLDGEFPNASIKRIQ